MLPPHDQEEAREYDDAGDKSVGSTRGKKVRSVRDDATLKRILHDEEVRETRLIEEEVSQ